MTKACAYKSNIIGVANYFIRRSIQESNLIQPLKLMKLCYIAYGIHLVKYDQKIFYNEIAKCKYGVIIPDLYDEIKMYKYSYIHAFLGKPYLNSSGEICYLEALLFRDEKIIKTLAETWNRFNGWTAPQLSDWTKKDAWKKTGSKFKFTRNNTIKDELIYKDFAGVVRDGR